MQWSKKGMSTKGLDQLKNVSMKIQEMISNIIITKKNEKLYQTTGIPGAQGAFSDQTNPDVDGFTNEPVVQCDAQVAKNIFINDSK